jgi:hypothetical protein
MFGFRHRELTGTGAVTVAAVAVLIGCGMKSSLPVGEPEELSVAGSGAAGSGEDQSDLDSGVDAANHCGNGIIEPEYGEQCDGTDLGGATCSSLREGPGRLRCGPACFFDVTMCEYSPPSGYGDGGGFGDGGPVPGPGPGDGGPILGPVF